MTNWAGIQWAEPLEHFLSLFRRLFFSRVMICFVFSLVIGSRVYVRLISNVSSTCRPCTVSRSLSFASYYGFFPMWMEKIVDTSWKIISPMSKGVFSVLFFPSIGPEKEKTISFLAQLFYVQLRSIKKRYNKNNNLKSDGWSARAWAHKIDKV